MILKMYSGLVTYVVLNVARTCDLGPHSNIRLRECQGPPRHFGDWHISWSLRLFCGTVVYRESQDLMRRVATKNVTVSIKEEGRSATNVTLTAGKIVTKSVLSKLSKSQIDSYTKVEGSEKDEIDVSSLSASDKAYYKKNKSHPDMPYGLSFQDITAP